MGSLASLLFGFIFLLKLNSNKLQLGNSKSTVLSALVWLKRHTCANTPALQLAIVVYQ